MCAVQKDSKQFNATKRLRRHQYAFTDEVNDQTIDGRRKLYNYGMHSNSIPASERFTDIMDFMPSEMGTSRQLRSHNLHKEYTSSFA